MPLEFLRFAPTGPRDPRETAQKCNNLGEATARQIAAIEGRLDLLETLIVELRFAAQAAMTLATPVGPGSPSPPPDITGAFQPITFFDTTTYERGATVDPITGQFTFSIEGDWALWFRFTLNHNGSGARRTLQVRVFNVTTATPGPTETITISSNVEDTSQTYIVPIAISAAQVGQNFRFEIGNASTNVTGVTWETANMINMFVGELGSLT